jgi:diamine N-acetyltransferase
LKAEVIQVSSQLSLLPIKPSDQKKLKALLEAIYKSAYEHFWTDGGDWYLELCYGTENLNKELSRDRSHYFFVEYQQEPVGILKYEYPFSPRQTAIANAMKLHRLYLDSSVHGKGVARDLMEFIEQVAMDNKLDYIWLEAMLEKPQAKRFYEKMGYEFVLSYQLDFERLLPDVRGIQIMKKKI